MRSVRDRLCGAKRRLRGAKRRVASDVAADPYLPYILALATILAGFWFWHLIPNFATRDEHDRLFDVLVALGSVLYDPGFASLKAGVTYGRAPYGATFYLFGIAVLPVVIGAFLTGHLDAFRGVYPPSRGFGAWQTWHDTPEWVWTWTLAFVRLSEVAFAVGCVYLTYRLGVALRGRTTGRLAGVLLTLSWGFLLIAHEGGEDIPALFFVLLAVYLAHQYVETGDAGTFLLASAAGGVAIAFKLTAAPVVGVIGLAYLLRGYTAEDWRGALARPGVLVGGAVIGAVMIGLGFPTLLVGGVDAVNGRIFDQSMSRMSHPTGPDAPVWWWFLRTYFAGLGLPLFVGVVCGAAASLTHYRDRASDTPGIVLVAFPLVVYLVVFSRWHDLRVHHLLPTFPLLVLLLAVGLARAHDASPSVARPVIAVLLVTTAAYAVAGDVGYATEPRDQATAWLETNAPQNATVEVYRVDMQDTAIPHDMAVSHAPGRGPGPSKRCPRYIELGYRDLLYLKPGTYYRNGNQQATYLRGLLDGRDGYEIVAEFGHRPPNFVPQRATPGSLVDLLPYGVFSRSDHYADAQEIGPNQYTLILERTGECDSTHTPSFSI